MKFLSTALLFAFAAAQANQIDATQPKDDKALPKAGVVAP